MARLNGALNRDIVLGSFLTDVEVPKEKFDQTNLDSHSGKGSLLWKRVMVRG